MKQINKKIWAFAILSVLVFTACDKTNETTVDETSQGNTQSSVMENDEASSADIVQSSAQEAADNNDQLDENNEQMPEPFDNNGDSGGDMNSDFYQPCISQFDSVPGSLLDIRPSGEVDEWLNNHFSRKGAVSSIKDYLNVYSFITDFNITKEEAASALEDYIDSEYESVRITQDQFNILFSGDIELITKTFASEYSIVHDDNIYSPEWIYTHSQSDYEAAGINAEDLAEKVPMYANLNLTEAARAAFSDKLSSYTGVAINIEPVQIYSETPSSVITDDIGIVESEDTVNSDDEIPVNIDDE